MSNIIVIMLEVVIIVAMLGLFIIIPTVIMTVMLKITNPVIILLGRIIAVLVWIVLVVNLVVGK